MARETIIDKFVTLYLFKHDKSALGKIENGVDKLTGRLNAAAKAATAVGVVGAAAFGAISAVGLGTDKALQRLAARSSASTKELAAFKEQAFAIGSDLPLNTADIVKAQEEYVKLGGSIKEALQDAPALAKGAVAGDATVADSARFARIARNTFGVDAARTIDVLVKAGNNAAGTFTEFGQAFQFSIQSAKDAGLAFEEYVALLGGMAGAGREVAGTSQGLQMVLGQIARSLNQDIGRGGRIAGTAFEKLGISMEELESIAQSGEGWFIRLLERINATGADASARIAALVALAGQSYSSSISFIVQNHDQVLALYKDLQGAGGEASRNVEVLMQGSSGAVAKALAMVDTVVNRLFDSGVGDALKRIADGISLVAGWFEAAAKSSNPFLNILPKIASWTITLMASMLGLAAALKLTAFILKFSMIRSLVVYILHATGAALATRRLVVSVKRYGIAATFAALWTKLSAFAMSLLRISTYKTIAAFVAAKIAAIALGITLNIALAGLPLLIAAIIAIVAVAIYSFIRWRDNIRAFFDKVPGWVLFAITAFAPFIGIPLLLIKYWDQLWDKLRGIAGWFKETFGGIAGGVGSFLGFGGGGGDEGAGGGSGGFPGLTTPLPVAGAAAGVSGAGSTLVQQFTTGDILVQSDNADPAAVAEEVMESLKTQRESAVRSRDSQVSR